MPIYVKVKGIDTAVPEYPGWIAISRDALMQGGDRWAIPFRHSPGAMAHPKGGGTVYVDTMGQTANQYGYDSDVAIYRPIPGWVEPTAEVVEVASPSPIPTTQPPIWSDVTDISPTMLMGDALVRNEATLQQILLYGTSDRGHGYVVLGYAGTSMEGYRTTHRLWRRSPVLEFDERRHIIKDGDPMFSGYSSSSAPAPATPAPIPTFTWGTVPVTTGLLLQRGDVVVYHSESLVYTLSKGPGGTPKGGFVVTGAEGSAFAPYIALRFDLKRRVPPLQVNARGKLINDGDRLLYGLPPAIIETSGAARAAEGTASPSTVTYLEITDLSTIIADGDILFDGDPEGFDPSSVDPDCITVSKGLILTRVRNGASLFKTPLRDITSSTRHLYRAFPKWTRLTDMSTPLEQGDVVCSEGRTDPERVVQTRDMGVRIGTLRTDHRYTVYSYACNTSLSVWRLTEKVGVAGATALSALPPGQSRFAKVSSSKGNALWSKPLTLP